MDGDLPAQVRHVVRAADKGQSKPIGPDLHPDLHIALVLFGECRQGNAGIGQIDPLARLERPALKHLGPDFAFPVGLDHLEDQFAVVQQDLLARMHVAGELRIGHVCPGGIAHTRLVGKGNDVPRMHLGPFGDLAHPEFGPLKIDQDGHIGPIAGIDLAHAFSAQSRQFGRSMGHVDAKDIHPGLDHIGHYPQVVRSRAERSDDFCLLVIDDHFSSLFFCSFFFPEGVRKPAQRYVILSAPGHPLRAPPRKNLRFPPPPRSPK